jgi:hypothetical protein
MMNNNDARWIGERKRDVCGGNNGCNRSKETRTHMAQVEAQFPLPTDHGEKAAS